MRLYSDTTPYGNDVRTMAHWLSDGEPDLKDDLMQEADIALWKFGEKRLAESDRPLVLTVIKRAMWKFLRDNEDDCADTHSFEPSLELYKCSA